MAASREEVFERVKEVLTEQLGVEENEITEQASFQEDLDADSLDLVELIMELEDQFGIKISDGAAPRSRPTSSSGSRKTGTSSRRCSRPRSRRSSSSTASSESSSRSSRRSTRVSSTR